MMNLLTDFTRLISASGNEPRPSFLISCSEDILGNKINPVLGIAHASQIEVNGAMRSHVSSPFKSAAYYRILGMQLSVLVKV